MRTPKTDEEKKQAAQIGARLKALRKGAKLSLQDIADRLNLEYGASTNKGMISKYENGVHEPSAGTLYCLSLILGVSVDYILGRTDERAQANAASGQTTVGAHLVKVYTRCNPVDGGDVDADAQELIPHSWIIGGREFFGFRIRGGRFAPRYYDGDILIFERRLRPSSEQVTLVSEGGGDAILCYVVKKREGKLIQPLDKTLPERYYTTGQLTEHAVCILGGAIQVRRMECSLDE